MYILLEIVGGEVDVIARDAKTTVVELYRGTCLGEVANAADDAFFRGLAKRRDALPNSTFIDPDTEPDDDDADEPVKVDVNPDSETPLEEKPARRATTGDPG